MPNTTHAYGGAEAPGNSVRPLPEQAHAPGRLLQTLQQCLALPGPHIAKTTYRDRIDKVLSLLAPESIAIFPTHKEKIRSRDLPYPFRPHSNVLYLNGFREPDSILVLSNIGGRNRVIMFVAPRDEALEQWTGPRAGRRGARKLYLADQAHHFDEFASVLAGLLDRAEHVYYRFGTNPDTDAVLDDTWRLAQQQPLSNPEHFLNDLRLIKSPEEVEMMRYAARISTEAHLRAMKACRPGMMEYRLQGLLEQTFTEYGARSPAYPSIVGAGRNSCVLHYIENRNMIRDGDLVLIDAGAEFEGYASDVTTTFPANGRFTEAQRQVYNLVLKTNRTIIEHAGPGMTRRKLQSLSERLLRAGLVDLGLLEEEMSTVKGEQAAVRRARQQGKLEPITLAKLYPHKFGHWIGLDTHDVGSPGLKGQSGARPQSGKRLAYFMTGYDRPFEPGMCLTDEPGVYIMPDPRLDKKWWFIGVRLEDDLLITKGGCEVLTSDVPRDPDWIERFMQAHSSNPDV